MVEGEKITIRHVEAKKVLGRKAVKGKIYDYEYYTLSLNIYVPRGIIERYGREFVVIKNGDRGVITIMPLRLAKEMRAV